MRKFNAPVVGKFHKVSFDEFKKNFDLPEEELRDIYDNKLTLPVRGTHNAMGHDFVSTKSVTLKPGETAKIPTGIRAEIDPSWGLIILPRSGFGVKFRMQIDNTAGVIDADYFFSDNEGHIHASITNDSKADKDLVIECGERFLQGIFMPYGITEDDAPLAKRNGGQGSTGV